jgi:peptidoglycan/xylan/chitin deacetylase (PgdA/CDA1 family)
MTVLPFRRSPRFAREPLVLPEDARVALYVMPIVEEFPAGKPAIGIFPPTGALPVDPLNMGWRDYGHRVGIWRIADVLEAHGVTPSVALCSAICETQPEIVAAGRDRGWSWINHGRDAATWQAGMDPDAERTYLEETTNQIERATGSRPTGWLGPALTETAATPDLLAELGYTHVLDWCNDDEPYLLDAGGGRISALPHMVEVSDIPIFHTHGRGPDAYVADVCGWFDRLYAEGDRRPSVMGLGLHPFLIGQPHRIGALERVLDHIAGHEGVWLATSTAIADWHQGAAAR